MFEEAICCCPICGHMLPIFGECPVCKREKEMMIDELFKQWKENRNLN